MNIFICHYPVLTDRYKKMKEQMIKYNLKHEFITDYPRNKLKQEDLIKFHKNIHSAICAVHLTHIECYKRIIDSSYNYNLILEDDAILEDNFTDNLEKYLKQLPEDYDMFFISSGCGTHIKYNEKNNVYKRNIYSKNGSTRSVDAYFVSKSCADKVVKYFNNNQNLITNAIDHWLNEVIIDLKLNIYWGEPTIISQGSATNDFKSSLNNLRKCSDR